MGPRGRKRGFQSRSMFAFQQSMEEGKTGHLFPVFDAQKKIASGQLKKEDIPYMQRAGGSWTQGDVKGAKKVASNKRDKGYSNVGYKGRGGTFEATSSLLTSGKIPWKAQQQKMDGLDSDQQMWRRAGALDKKTAANRQIAKIKVNPKADEKKKKGPFGLW